MKFFTIHRIIRLITFLAVGAFCPSLHADWSSLHGNNRSAPAQSAAPRSQPQESHQQQAPPVESRSQPQPNHAAQPTVRAPEPRQESKPVQAQPVARAPETRQEVKPVQAQSHVADRVQSPRAAEPVRSSPVTVDRGRAQATEVDRRRMDIDADRRQSFYWSDYHAGMRIDRLPDGYRRFDLRGRPFFYYEGVYYDGGPSGYVIIAPPIDAIIPGLPPGTETVVVGNMVYYYAGGAFYVQQPDGDYVVVAPPMGVTVTMFPPAAVSVGINGTIYYQANGTYYQPVMQNGVTAYLTVSQP